MPPLRHGPRAQKITALNREGEPMHPMHALAGIFDTPIHPILVSFTTALIPLSLVNDLLAKILHRDTLATAAWWMLFYAALITPVTVFAGWLWYRQMPDMDHWQMPYHMWLGISLA